MTSRSQFELTQDRDPLFRAALLWIVLFAVAGTVLFTVVAIKFLPRHGDNTYTETPAIYAALQSSTTGHIYIHVNAPPYTPQPYGPLFYLFNSAVARAVGGDRVKLYAIGHGCAYLTFLACALLIYLICGRLGYGKWTALLSALFFIGLPFQTTFNVSIRPDYPCLALMLGSLLCVMTDEPASLGPYVFAGLLAGAAFLVKQPGFAVCMVIAGVLVWRRQFARTAIFLLSSAVPVVAMLGWLALRHDPFWSQMTVVLGAIWSLPSGVQFVLGMLRDPNKVVPIATLLLGFPLAVRSGERGQLAGWFALLNLGVGLATIPQLGGAMNYFFSAYAGSALLLPFAIETTARQWKGLRWAICGITIVWLSVCLVRTAESHWTSILKPQDEPPAHVAALENLRIFSDRPNFDLLGRDPEFMDPAMLHMLELRGKWDAAPLVRDLRDAKFDLIVLANAAPRVTAYRGMASFSWPQVEAMNASYEVLCQRFTQTRTIFGAMVLVPRNRPSPVTADLISQVIRQPCVAQPPGTAPGLYLDPQAR